MYTSSVSAERYEAASAGLFAVLRGGHLQQLHHFDFIGFGPKASFDYVFHVYLHDLWG